MIAALLSLLTAFLWACNVVLMRRGLAHANPLHGAFISASVGIPIMAAASLLTGEIGGLATLDTDSLILAAAAGLVGMTAARALGYTSIKMIGAARSSPLFASQTLFSAFLGFAVLDEALTTQLIFAALLVFAGVWFVTSRRGRVTDSSSNGERPSMTGVALGLTAGFGWAVLAVVARVGVVHLGSPVLFYMISTLAATPACGLLVVGTKARPGFRGLSLRDLTLLVAAGVAHTFGTLSMYTALSLAPVVFVMPIAGTHPLFALILSYVFLQKAERVNLILVCGAILIVLGTYLVVTS